MKGKVVAAHEKAGVMPKRSESKCKSGGGYCKEASKRFPHLTNGSNRGFKAEGGVPMSTIYDQIGKIGAGMKGVGDSMPKDDEKPWFKQVV